MERRLAAIFFADLVGYSRRMEQDERGTFVLVKSIFETVFEPTIARFRGRIIKVMGDCVMAEFPSVLDAVNCAQSVQSEVANRNRGLEPKDQVAYRIGVNVGDIINDEGDVYGDMVNIASRVESLAGPREVWVTRPVRDQIRDRINVPLEDRGCIKVKNISRPVRVFRLVDGEIVQPERAQPGWITRNRLALGGVVVAGLLLFSGQLQTNHSLPPDPELEQAEFEAAEVQTAVLLPKQGSYVTQSRTNLRLGPGTSFGVARTVAPGTPLELTGSVEEPDGDWYQVRGAASDDVFFVYSGLLTPATEETGVKSELPELNLHDDAWHSPTPERMSDVVASLSPELTTPEQEERIWFRLVLDTANSMWQDCDSYGSSSIHSMPRDQASTWKSVFLKDAPYFALKVRALDQVGRTAMEVWPFSHDWPESSSILIPLPALEPGNSARAFSKRRADAPLEVCGTFSVYVDVIEEPENE
ncbi:MAG: adenylate/guanylate cyclase domain-containing protein [Pseudomonadota bacterium]